MTLAITINMYTNKNRVLVIFKKNSSKYRYKKKNLSVFIYSHIALNILKQKINGNYLQFFLKFKFKFDVP